MRKCLMGSSRWKSLENEVNFIIILYRIMAKEKTYTVSFTIKWDVVVKEVEATNYDDAISVAQDILYSSDIDNIEIIDYDCEED